MISISTNLSYDEVDETKQKKSSSLPQDLTKYFTIGSSTVDQNSHSFTPDMELLSSEETSSNPTQTYSKDFEENTEIVCSGTNDTDDISLSDNRNLSDDENEIDKNIFELALLKRMSDALPSLGELDKNSVSFNHKSNDILHTDDSVHDIGSSKKNSHEIKKQSTKLTHRNQSHHEALETSMESSPSILNSHSDKESTHQSPSSINLSGVVLQPSPSQNILLSPKHDSSNIQYDILKGPDDLLLTYNLSPNQRMKEARRKLNAASAALNQIHGTKINLKHESKGQEDTVEYLNEPGPQSKSSSQLSRTSQIELYKDPIDANKGSSMQDQEREKTVATISSLTNEASQLYQIRTQDKHLLDKKESHIQSISIMLAKEKELSRQRLAEINSLQKKVSGFEHVIVSEQYTVNEEYASKQIHQIQIERDVVKEQVLELEKINENDKEKTTQLNYQIEVYQRQNKELTETNLKQEKSIKICTNDLDRTEILLKSSKAENERLRDQIKNLESGIFSGEEEVKKLTEENRRREKELDNQKTRSKSIFDEKHILQDGLIALVRKKNASVDDKVPPNEGIDYSNAIKALAVLGERLLQLKNVEFELKSEKDRNEKLRVQISSCQKSQIDIGRIKGELNEKILNLEEEILKEKEYSNQGYEQIYLLENIVKDTKEREASLMKSNEENKNEKLILEGKNTILDSQILEHVKTIHDKGIEVDQFRTRLERSEQFQSTLNTENQELSQRLITLKKCLDSESEEVRRLNELTLHHLAVEEEVSTTRKKLEELSQSNILYCKELEDYESKCQTMQHEKEELIAQMETSEMKRKDTLKEIAQLQNSFTQMKQTKESLDELAAALEECVASEKVHSLSLSSQLESVNNEILSHKEQLSELESSLLNETRRNHGLEGNVETLTVELRKKHETLEELWGSLKLIEGSIEFIQSLVFPNPEEYGSTKDDNEDDGTVLKTVEKRLSNFKSLPFSVKRTNSSRENSKENFIIFEREIFNVSNQLSKAQVELSRALERIEEKDKSLSSHIEQNEDKFNNSIVSNRILHWESKAKATEQNYSIKQSTSTKNIELNATENIKTSPQVSNINTSNFLIEIAALEATVEEHEKDKAKIFSDMQSTRNDLLLADDEREEMLKVISELAEELENTESQRLELLKQLKKDSPSECQKPINEYSATPQEICAIPNKEINFDFDHRRASYETLNNEKHFLQNKLNHIESTIKEWQRQFAMVKNIFSSHESSSDTNSFDSFSNLSAILPADNESVEVHTLEDYQVDFVTSYRFLAKKYRRAQDKISILGDTLIELKAKARTSIEEKAAESAEVKKADETAEAEARRADHAENQLSEVLDLLEESNRELTEAVRLKCSLESQLSEAMIAINAFEFGSRMNVSNVPNIPKIEVSDIHDTDVFGKLIHIVKGLTVFLREDFGSNRDNYRDHITQAWRNLGWMSRAISDLDKDHMNQIQPERFIHPNFSEASSLSNDTPAYKTKEFSREETKTLVNLSLHENENKKRMNLNEITISNTESHNFNSEDKYFAEFHRMIQEGESNLQSALKDVYSYSNTATKTRKETYLSHHIDDSVPNVISNCSNSLSLSVDNEPDMILSEALNLIESMKQAHAANIDAAKASARTKHARELAEHEKKARDQLSNVITFMNSRFERMESVLKWKLWVEQERRKKILQGNG